jgi:catalase
MLSSLVNVSDELARAVADGLGLEVPGAMPKASDARVKPEITVSPPLSLMALPGDGSIATRKVAILIGDGMATASIMALTQALTKAGAVTRFLGVRLGTCKGADGELEADATLENSPAVLFDAVILPDGAGALARTGQAVDFVKDQYRHCKTLLVLGDGTALLEKAGIPLDKPDDGLLIKDGETKVADAFIAALAMHRHVERDMDPPPV